MAAYESYEPFNRANDTSTLSLQERLLSETFDSFTKLLNDQKDRNAAGKGGENVNAMFGALSLVDNDSACGLVSQRYRDQQGRIERTDEKLPHSDWLHQVCKVEYYDKTNIPKTISTPDGVITRDYPPVNDPGDGRQTMGAFTHYTLTKRDGSKVPVNADVNQETGAVTYTRYEGGLHHAEATTILGSTERMTRLYDDGHLTSLTNAKGQVTRFEYLPSDKDNPHAIPSRIIFGPPEQKWVRSSDYADTYLKEPIILGEGKPHAEVFMVADDGRIIHKVLNDPFLWQTIGCSVDVTNPDGSVQRYHEGQNEPLPEWLRKILQKAGSKK